MLGGEIRLFFEQLFWTKKEKEFYDIFHVSARIQRAAKKDGYLDLDGMVRAWKQRQLENKNIEKRILKVMDKYGIEHEVEMRRWKPFKGGKE